MENSSIYSKYVKFPVSKGYNFFSDKVIWIAIFIVYIIANLPIDIIQNILLQILQEKHFLVSFISSADQELLLDLTQKIIKHFVLPGKQTLFLVGLIVLGYPVIKSLVQTKSFWIRETLQRRAKLSILLFSFLCVLIIPYRFPFGLGGMGVGYGAMSLNPFGEPYGWLHRRLLKPALAYFLHMDGLILYYLFSMILTYILIYMTIAFFEIKSIEGEFSEAKYKEKEKTIFKNKIHKLVYYTSILTSSYIMLNYQWPGHTEHLAFILILIAATIPMTAQGRLSIVALSMATHEGNMFSLAPIIVFCFPRQERFKSLLLIPLWICIWLSTRGFDVAGGLSGHNMDGALQALLENIDAAIGGVFFSYKLLWLVLFYILWVLWNSNEKIVSLAISSIVLTPLIMVLTIDVSRNVGYGFLGLLIALSILLWENKIYFNHRFLSVVILSNLICPSFLLYTNTPLVSFPGLYKIFCLSCRMD